MGLLTDASMIQYRVLNRSRGAAVQAPRAQVDKALYSALARRRLESLANLEIRMDTVTDILADASGSRVEGVVTERGGRIGAAVVVLTTGTFMEGRLFIGEWEAPGGRLGEGAAVGLGTELRAKGFTLGRMKTGTPARVRGRSLDYGRMERQEGEPPRPFSFRNDGVDRPSVPCWITYTTEATHEAIRAGLGRSPLFGGQDHGARTPLLPLHRGQGGPLPGAQPPPGLRGARGPRHGRDVPQRPLVLPARGGPGGLSARRARPGAGGDRPPRLRGRVRLPRPPPALSLAGDQAASRALHRGPDQRDLRVRGGGLPGHPGGDQRLPAPPGRGTPGPLPLGVLHRGAGRRPDHPRHQGALPHVHQPSRAPPFPAARHRGRPPHAPGAAIRAWWTTRPGSASSVAGRA